MDDLICVRTFNDRPRAEMAQAVLAEHEILSLIEADDAGGIWPGLGWTTGGVRVLVTQEDAELARAALEGVETP